MKRAGSPKPASVRLSNLVALTAILTAALGSAAYAQRPLGVDVSYWQPGHNDGMPQSNWDAIAAEGRTFAICRITHWSDVGESDAHGDPDLSCKNNVARARAARIGTTPAPLLVGVYHFARPDKRDPITEADAFVNYATHYFQDGSGNYINYLSAGYLRPMLDLEEGSDTLHVGASSITDWCLQWMDRVEAQTGAFPMIYTGANYTKWLSPGRITDHPLVFSNYWCGSDPQTSDPAASLGPWTYWNFWQYCSSLSVGGVSPIDTDVFHGTAEELQAYIIGNPLPFRVQSSGITNTAATVTWMTDLASNSQVQYGTTTAYGSSTPLDSTLVKSHSRSLTGLTPKTVYHYRVASAAGGTPSYSRDFTFYSDGTPTISNVQAGSITTNSAVITWTTDENATSQVNYGETAAYGSQTALDSNKVTSHSVTITGLSPFTTYHYQVYSDNAYPPSAQSSDFTFTTLATPPVISNVQAGNLGETTATITWDTNVPSTSEVQYGTTTSYGRTTPIDNNLVTSHAVNLSGLYPGTTYHYRVISRVEGNPATSADYTFTTTATPPAPLIKGVAAASFSYDTYTTYKLTVTWTTTAPGNTQVQYGTTASYGSSTTLNTSMVTSHSATISGLNFNTTYHFRARSANSGNVTCYSADHAISPIMVDDNATGWTKNGTWTQGSLAQPKVGTYYLYKHPVIGGTGWVKWTPTIPSAGSYDVWAFYQVGTARCSVVTYKIVYSGGTLNNITQNQNGASSNTNWYKLNTTPLSFAAGTSGYLQVSDDGSETGWYVSADAAMFVPVPTADSQLPTVPSNVTATVISTSAVQLNWTGSTDNVGVVGYNIYRGDTYVGSSATTSFTDLGLVANTSYSYQITAFDEQPNESAKTAAVSRTTLSVPPTSGSLTADASSICSDSNVVWTAVGGFGADSVQYYRYAWDQSETYSFSGSEPQWSGETLTTTATAAGDWYLHVQGFNSEDVANGAYDYVITNPCRNVAEWRSVRSHGGASDVGMVLDPNATYPTVESRAGGIRLIEVQFNGPVTLGSASAVQVSGQTTTGGVPGDAVSYTPASVSVVSGNTLAIAFDPDALPDVTCYTIALSAGVIQEQLTGTVICRVRALADDVTGNGTINLGDALFIQSQIGQPVNTATAAFDVNLDGVIDISDALAAKARVSSPAVQVVCP